MRVLLVADVSAERVLGGAERMLDRHVRALASAHEVTVLSRQPRPDASLTVSVAGGVTEHRLPFSGDRGPRGLWELMRGARAWWRAHRGAFDVVVAEQPFAMWALRRAGCDLPRLQVCYAFAYEEYATRHGLDWGWKHRLVGAGMRRVEGALYASARRLFVLSDYTRRRLAEAFPDVTRPVDVAWAGVEARPLASEAARAEARRELGWEGPVVVSLRNLVPRQGLDMLVQAAAILRHDMPELRWCVMGEGPLREGLEWLARQLKVDDIVEFPGFLPEEEVKRRMDAADAFMLPTRALEGFGLVTVEANERGLPVVATPAGANPEVAGASPDNVVAEAISPDALARATRELLMRREDHAARARRLHAQVRREFDWARHDELLLRAVARVAG